MSKNEDLTPSLFNSNNRNNEDKQENDIESKLQKRQEDFSNEENFSKIKESTMSNELSLGQNFRNKIFMQKRLKQNMITETTESLKNKLTIPLDWFEKCNNMNVQLSQFHEIIVAFRTQDIKQKYLGLVGIRKLLSLQNSPIQELIDVGVIIELIALLDNSPAEFQYEALWCLTIIASGTSDQANSIVIKGGVPKIVKLLESSIEELKVQAVWIIGNLAIDSYRIRDSLIKEKIFEKLLTILASTNQKQLIRQCTWALSSFFRVKPVPPYNLIKKAIKMIARAMVMLPNDIEFLTDACFILSFMTEHYKETIKDLLELDIISNIIKCLDIDTQYIQISCLRVVGNIASGNANQTQLLIDRNVLDYLKKTLFNQKKTIRKESAWILSNIAAGTQKQIETLIEQDFLLILSEAIEKDDPEIKKECIWAVCNLTSVENEKYIKKILDQGILRIICKCLEMKDAKYLAVCIEAFSNLLAFGKKSNPAGPNPVVLEVEKMGMFDILEKLQYHPVEIVYDKILKLLENYFEVAYIQ